MYVLFKSDLSTNDKSVSIKTIVRTTNFRIKGKGPSVSISPGASAVLIGLTKTMK